MPFLDSGRRALACLALALALPLVAGSAQASILTYTSPAGETLGGGVGTRSLSEPDATFTADGSLHHVVIDVDQDDEHWNLQFSPAAYVDVLPPLHRGIYANAEHAAVRTERAAGLEINGPHGNCLVVYGSFNVRQLEFDDLGVVKLLDVTFKHRCGGPTAPLLSGTLYYNTGPKYFSWSRDPGFPVASAYNSRAYYGDTSDTHLAGGMSAFTYGVSGLRDEWYFAFSPPTGQKFAKKTYALLPAADATNAGITMSKSPGSTCSAPSGSLVVRKLAYNDDGTLDALYATFTVTCNGNAPAFRGTIRHKL